MIEEAVDLNDFILITLGNNLWELITSYRPLYQLFSYTAHLRESYTLLKMLVR